MSIQLDLELLPLEILCSRNWVLEEGKTGLYIDISVEVYKELIEEYTWVEWELIIKESQKVEIKFNYLPQAVKAAGTWDLIQVKGEWVVYLTQKHYREIKKKYNWIILEKIPVGHHSKIVRGDIVNIEGVWVAIISKAILSTIFRKHQARG